MKIIPTLLIALLLMTAVQAALVKETITEGETDTFLTEEGTYEVNFVSLDLSHDEPRVVFSVNDIIEDFREGDDEDFGTDVRIFVDEILTSDADALAVYYFSAPGPVTLVVENETEVNETEENETEENKTLESLLEDDVLYSVDGFKFGINSLEGGQVRFVTEDGLTPYYDEGDSFAYQEMDFEVVTIGDAVLLRTIVEIETVDCAAALVCGEDGEWRDDACTAFLEHIEVVDNSFCEEETCNDEYLPVCGEDNETYDNYCVAEEANVTIAYDGECSTCSEPDEEQDAGRVLLNPGITHTVVVEDREFTVEWNGEVMESFPEQYPIEINGRSVTLTRGQERTFTTDDYTLVVKARTVTDCGYLPVNFNYEVVEDPDVPTFPDETTRVRMKLDKGWNLITLPGLLQRFVPTNEEKVLGYVWIVEEGKYYTMQEARELLGSRFKEYLMTHAFWVYSYGNQELVVDVEPADLEEVGVVRGWNLLPIISPFVDESIQSLDGVCDLTGAYLWDSKKQEWRTWSKEKRFTSKLVGEGLLLQNKNTCTLTGGIVDMPDFPDFPGFPDSDDDDEVGEYRIMNHGQIVSAIASSKSKGKAAGWIPPGQAKKYGNVVKVKYKDGKYEVEWEDVDEDDD